MENITLSMLNNIHENLLKISQKDFAWILAYIETSISSLGFLHLV